MNKNFKYSPKYVKEEMKRIIRCMDILLKRFDKRFNQDAYDMYQLIGGGAWTHLAEHCPHEYKTSKRFPTGKCKLCGSINNENKKRIRK